MKRQKMRTEQKSNVKNSVGRLVFVGLSLLLQVLWILLLFLRLNAYSTAISLCFSVGAFLVALSIYAKHENAAKLWIEYALSPDCVNLAQDNGSCFMAAGQMQRLKCPGLS